MTIVVVLVSLALVGAWAVRSMGIADTFRSAPDYAGPGTGSVDVVIPAGASASEIGDVLVQAGVVESAQAFKGAMSDNPAAVVPAGTVKLKEQMRASDALLALADPANKIETDFTITEGMTAQKAVEVMAKASGVPAADFEKVLKDPKAGGLPSQAGDSYEGWLFPATYAFQPSATAEDIVRSLVQKTVSTLDALGVPAADRQRVLTVASIAEAEVNSARYYAQVARVIENRLASAETGGKLEMDGITAYGLGKSGLDLTAADLASAENPYNTRVHAGLPPTPIGNPGRAAIQAALEPARGDWIYFCTVNLDTGETKFTGDYDEFLRYKAEYQEWLAQNPQ